MDSVAQVNLLCGKNNTGKTSVLEAIALLACGGDFDYMISLLDKHGYLNDQSPTLKRTEMVVQTLSSLFSNRKPKFIIDQGIKICDNNNDNVYVDIDLFYYKGIVGLGENRMPLSENEIEDTDRYSVGLQVRTAKRCQEKYQEELAKILSDKEHYYYYTDKFQLIESGEINRISNGKLFDKIALKDPEDTIVEALQIIEPGIKRIGFINEEPERTAVVKLSTIEEVIPLSDMGDGINRILTIILAMVNAENGFLLIDEFENGLHYSVQEKLWKVIFKLAKDLNVQVFATTHSNDCIASFSRILNEGNNGVSGQMIRLDNKNGNIKPEIFSSEELNIARKQFIEIR